MLSTRSLVALTLLIPGFAFAQAEAPAPPPPASGDAFGSAGATVTVNHILAEGAQGRGGMASAEIGVSRRVYLEGRLLLSQIEVERDRTIESGGTEYPVVAEFTMLGGGLVAGYRGERGGISGGLVGVLHGRDLCPKDAPQPVRDEECSKALLFPVLPSLHARLGRHESFHATVGVMERGATHLDYVRAGVGMRVGGLDLWGGFVSGELGSGTRVEAGWNWRYAAIRPAVSFGRGESGSWVVGSLTVAIAGGTKPGAP